MWKRGIRRDSLRHRPRRGHRKAVNAVITAAPGIWMYYCYNAEYLFFPFSEHRTMGEMLAFHSEERRDAVLTYVVDLYATDLASYPNAVSLDYAYLDRLGYYSLKREGPDGPKERQLDFFGGLRWRFEEHIPGPAAGSTASVCSVPSRGWCCDPTTPSTTRNTTPMIAAGTTT